MTQEQKDRIDHRTLATKRNGLELNQKVTVTDEYKQVFKCSLASKSEFLDGIIVSFSDPYDFNGKTATSLATIEFSCGCRELRNVTWLKKKD